MAAAGRFGDLGLRNGLTGGKPRLYCAPFQVKGVFEMSRALTGTESQLYLKVFPRAFVAAGCSLKIRTGNLCGDSRHLPLEQFDMGFQNDQSFIRAKSTF
jgi:hypothetical protein